MTIFEFITENENTIRLSFFLSTLLIMGLWEIIAPKRALTVSKAIRWSNNLGLVFFNSFMMRLILPVTAVGLATFTANQGWGILNYYTIPLTLSVIISVIAMDFIIYLQHVLVHAVPVLWRLHRVHHADLDYDVTTGARFHTLEIFLSMLIKFATIAVLGPPVVAVIIFEVILNAMAMFNHANIGLPKTLDKALRWFVVTPDMHRIHHSIEEDETNSNFGFSISWWDRLFGTYKDQPRYGHIKMKIGIQNFTDVKQTNWITGMLAIPFVGNNSRYTINKRSWEKNDEK